MRNEFAIINILLILLFLEYGCGYSALVLLCTLLGRTVTMGKNKFMQIVDLISGFRVEVGNASVAVARHNVLAKYIWSSQVREIIVRCSIDGAWFNVHKNQASSAYGFGVCDGWILATSK